MIPVTRPFFPPLADLHAHLTQVWEAGWLTNQGPKARALEAALAEHCGAPVALLANGTLALQIGIRALGMTGRVATTPFSFVATVSSLLWEGRRPVFVDIDPDTYNLSPDALEALDDVSGVLGTHVYGVPCDVDRIGALAAERGWKVLYDAAHAFGTTWAGRPIFGEGDLAATSFHATKLFHTGEGGGLFTRDPELLAAVVRLRSFGQTGPDTFVEVGTNAKQSELHASMGLAVLPWMSAILARRREQSERYRSNLAGRVRFQAIPAPCGYNHAYVPILLRSETELLRVVAALGEHQIVPRRYFYPSLSSLAWVGERQPTPVADDVARRVLCLPVFHDLAPADVDRISSIVDGAIASRP